LFSCECERDGGGGGGWVCNNAIEIPIFFFHGEMVELCMGAMISKLLLESKPMNPTNLREEEGGSCHRQ
jgi:hypothetical protein